MEAKRKGCMAVEKHKYVVVSLHTLDIPVRLIRILSVGKSGVEGGWGQIGSRAHRVTDVPLIG